MNTRPAMRRPMIDQAAAWAEEKARLEDRIADLVRTMAGRARDDGPVAGLSVQQTMIVALIAKRGRVSRPVMHAFLCASGFEVGEESGSVRHQISRARASLAAHGVTITTLPGWGWEMDRTSRLTWARLALPAADLAEIAAEGGATGGGA